MVFPTGSSKTRIVDGASVAQARQGKADRQKRESMPLITPPTLVRFDASLFTPNLLVVEDGLQKASEHLRQIIQTRSDCLDVALHVILDGLVDQPYIFEYICASCEHVRSLIAQNVASAFPKSPKDYFGSKWQILFDRMKRLILENTSVADARTLNRVSSGINILKLCLDLDGEALSLEQQDTNGETKMKQGEIKRAKRNAQRIASNQKVLDAITEISDLGRLQINLPRNAQELEHGIAHLVKLAHQGIIYLVALLEREEVRTLCLERVGALRTCMDRIQNKDTTQSREEEPQVGNAELQTETLGAIQGTPIQCSLLVRNAKKLGPWKIFLSGAAVNHYRQHGKTGSLDMITKKIKELSDGFFSDSNMKQLTGSKEKEFPIYEAKLSKNLRIIYQVDVFPDTTQSSEMQAWIQGITVWGIYNHQEIRRRTWELVARKLHSNGKEYGNRCKQRWQPNRGEYYHPVSFPPPTIETTTSENDDFEMTREEELELHNLLVLQKKYPLSEHLYQTIRLDKNASHIFSPSGDEIKIIEHPTSCYVIGRSGTGKTTAMLYKMLAVEATYLENQDSFTRRPRQLFVTQSRVLAARVKEYYDSLALTLGKVKKGGPEDKSEQEAVKNRGDDVLLAGMDDDGLPHRLPRRFDELEEKDFPLFLSFDQLCKLFENQFKLNFGGGSTSLPGGEAGYLYPSATAIQDEAESFSNTSVTYDLFQTAYWKHFPETLTKRLNPFLIYCEIIGVIKGSEETLGNKTGILEEEDYVNISARTKATFADQRHLVYQIFQHYQKKKREYRDYDSADRSRSILQKIKGGLSSNNKVEYLYVDEVQDQSIVEIQLLRSLCRNPQGLCWAGDTAQTIAAGSTFRFNDLKATLHRLETARTGMKLSAPTDPPVFHLRKNYRSHGGIVDCAASVVDIITHFWPESIDRLDREEGVVEANNLKPIFFKHHEDDQPPYMHFIAGESPIEFGAEQCILVRDTASRDRLRKAVGDIGIILTIYECKGLEFSDVLLYDFFKDSTVNATEWRLVLGLLPQAERDCRAVPEFSPLKFRGLSNELKNLYVAITRARSQVWIMDSSEKGESMRTYWSAQHKIVNWESGIDLPPMAVSSTADEWKRRGTIYFEHNNYQAALYSFERAGEEALAAVCRAHILLQKAEELERSVQSKSSARKAFINAGEAFDNLPSKARKWQRMAADCFGKGGNNIKAAERYKAVGLYDKAIQHYWEGKAYDEASEVLSNYRSKLSPGDEEKYEGRLRSHYVRLGNFRKAALLFESDEDQLQFMEDRVLDQQMAQFLIYKQRHEEAADIYLAEDDTLRAIDTLLDPECKTGVPRAHTLLTDEFWKRFPLHCAKEIPEDGHKLVTLLDIAESKADFTNLGGKEFREFRLIHFSDAKSNDKTLRFEQLERHAKEYTNQPMAAMGIKLLDACLGNSLPLETLKIISGYLKHYDNYERILRQLAHSKDMINNLQAQRLFGFRPNDEGGKQNVDENEVITILPRSPLRQELPFGTPQALAKAEWKMGERDLRFRITQFTKTRLEWLAIDEERNIRNYSSLKICTSFALSGHCRYTPSCQNQHYRKEELTKEFYWNMLQTVLLQFNLMSNIPANMQHRHGRLQMQGWWFSLLHDTLRPPGGKFATQIRSSIPSQMLDQVRQSSLKKWMEEALYQISPRQGLMVANAPKNFIYDLTLTAYLAFSLYPEEVKQYYGKTPSCLPDRPVPDLQRSPTDYVVHDMFVFLEGKRQSYLNQGLFFLKHTIDKRMIIDVNILTCYAEQLCAKLMLQEKILYRGDFHNLHLPRSWMLLYFHQVPPYASRFQKEEKIELIRTLGKLMNYLHHGVGEFGHLRLQGTSSTLRNPHVSATFIERLCRCISLVGYNGRNWEPDVRETVTWELQRLGGADHRASYYRYTSLSHGWKDVTKALLLSFAEDNDEELLAFSHSGKNPVPPRRGVRIVQYKDPNDLNTLIQYGLPAKRPTFLGSVFESKGIDDLLKSRKERLAQEEAGKKETVAAAAEDDDPGDQGSEGEPEDDGTGEAVIENPSQASTPAEIQAATRIQTEYRKYIQAQPSREKGHRLAKEDALFRRCLHTFGYRQGLPDNYRRVCLWRLPTLLTLVEALDPVLKNLKAHWKNQWHQADNVDAADKNLRKIGKLIKSHKRIKDSLDIGSPGLMQGKLKRIEDQSAEFRSILDDIDSMLERSQVDKLRTLLNSGSRRLGSYMQPLSAKDDRPSLNTEDLD